MPSKKLFIIGLPNSGRTTIAKSICNKFKHYHYISYNNWVKSLFRDIDNNEHIQKYQEAFNDFKVNLFKSNPAICIDVIRDLIDSNKSNNDNTYVIDGVFSPKDFAVLFDFNKDTVVFLNRTDNEADSPDVDNIGISVMRDYCFWMSSAGFLNKERWIEYNYKFSHDDNDYIKSLGSKNSVYLVKSVNKVISHLTSILEV